MRVEQDNWTFQGLVTFLLAPFVTTDKFASTQATPVVFGRQSIYCSGAVITITNFLKGTDGQTIRLLGDGTTTIANNANIKTNTGAAKLLSANKVYRFTFWQSVHLWIEDA